MGRGWDPIGLNATMMGWYWGVPNGGCVTNDMRLMNIESFKEVVRTVGWASSYNGPTAQGYRGYLFQTDALNLPGLSVSDRHFGGTVLGMLVGHVKWYKTTMILANPSTPFTCRDFSHVTPATWLDLNAAKLKLNLQDSCIPDPTSP